MVEYTRFQEWLVSKNPNASGLASIEVFLEGAEEIVRITHNKGGIDTGESVSKILDYQIFNRTLIKGVLEWLKTYQSDLKTEPYEYTSRDNTRDWEHDKIGWSMAISSVMYEFKELREEGKL